MKFRWPEGGLAGGTGIWWSLQVPLMSICGGGFVVATSALGRAHGCGLGTALSRNPVGADKTFLLHQVSLRMFEMAYSSACAMSESDFGDSEIK